MPLDVSKKYAPKNLKFSLGLLTQKYTEDWNLYGRDEKLLMSLSFIFLNYHRAGRLEEGLNYIKSVAGEDYVPYVYIYAHKYMKADAKVRNFLFKHVTKKQDAPS